jgi:hypothetical protein
MTNEPGRVQALLAEFARVGVASEEQFRESRASPPAGQSASIPHADMMAVLKPLPDQAGPRAVRHATLAYCDRLPRLGAADA